jgi:hypothetical protein
MAVKWNEEGMPACRITAVFEHFSIEKNAKMTAHMLDLIKRMHDAAGVLLKL